MPQQDLEGSCRASVSPHSSGGVAKGEAMLLAFSGDRLTVTTTSSGTSKAKPSDFALKQVLHIGLCLLQLLRLQQPHSRQEGVPEAGSGSKLLCIDEHHINLFLLLWLCWLLRRIC